MNTNVNNSFIDLAKIQNALVYYTMNGFKSLSVPMCIDMESMESTLVPEKRAEVQHYEHKDGQYYVGSAEQSFVYLMNEGKMPKGRHMALTPCMRSDTPDETHFQTFLKLELIDYGSVDVQSVLDIALNFVLEYDPNATIELSDGLRVGEKDIIVNGIEVGSYGIHNHCGVPFVYATGIAEPRLTLALSKGK